WISMRSDWGKKHYTDNVIPRTILTRILKRLAKRAEIKKRVYPHLFRHSIATQWAKEFTETELKILGGWCRHSKMTQVYLHLSGADVEQKLLEKRGLIKKAALKKREEVLKPKECPRCQETNPATAKFCLRCSLVLDQKTALQLDTKMKGLDELMNISMEQKTKEIQKGADLIDIIADKVAERLKR
ncbi:MAG: hypothetical protein ACE5NG_15320, partial [bacterium]